MDRKTILAIFISILVLIVYDIIFIAPDRQKRLEESKVLPAQVADSPSPTQASETPVNIVEDVPATPSLEDEQIQTLISKALTVTFSDLGGQIKKIEYNNFHNSLPIENLFGLPAAEKYQLTALTDDSVTYVTENNGLRIKKIYTVDEYLIKQEVAVENTTDKSITIPLNIRSFDIDATQVDKAQASTNSLLEYSIKTPNKVYRKGNAFRFETKESKSYTQEVEWVAFRDRYFCTIIKPMFPSQGAEVTVVDSQRLRVVLKAGDVTINPGAVEKFEFVSYTGPQDFKLLEEFGLGFEKLMAFSNFGLIDVIAKFIHNFLFFLHKYVPNWGVCIIILSFLVYAVTYPLTFKSMSSMKKMQAIQPKIQALREKYKNDPQKLNSEMMEIYKSEKINPFGGCLPILIQMPVFIGLYQVLWRSVYLKGGDFLWIKDLSEPDRLFLFPWTIPFLGNEFNILPLLMMGIMFIQQKISSKSMVITDETQLAQQKMMLIFFPLLMGFIFYHMASGLNLYFTVFYFLSALTQYKMSKLSHVTK